MPDEQLLKQAKNDLFSDDSTTVFGAFETAYCK